MNKCSVTDCDRPQATRGWCRKHYNRWYRHGDPLAVRKVFGTVEDRLNAYLDKTATCWLWTGHLNPNGYAQIKVDGKDVYVHRAAYETWIGPIPEGLQIDHLCRVRHCANPHHLEPVTGRENTRRTMKGSCNKGHEFTEENTRIRSNGNRICRACHRERARESYTRKRT